MPMVVAVGVALASFSQTAGQEPPNAAGQAARAQIPFAMVDGRPCARCTLTSAKTYVPANVVIDLGQRAPLVIHETTARLLGVSRRTPVDVKFDGLELTGLLADSAKLTSLEALTLNFSAELGEIPAAAIFGLPALADYVVQLDIPNKTLRLLPAATAVGPDAGQPGTTTFTYEAEGHGYWLSAVGPDEQPMRIRFATAQYDTIIDSTVADLAGAPAGNLAKLLLGPIDLTRFVALRPEDLSSVPDPRPDVILGTNFLSSFRVTIDPANRRMTFEQAAAPQFPQEEQAYFIARQADDAAAIEAFLTEHGSSRLAAEAADKLLALRLDEYPPPREAIKRAMTFQAGAARVDRRAATMVALADTLLAGKRDDREALATEALIIATESAAQDGNARATHDIHARQGLLAMHRDDLKEARRNLLSAAFGLPKDPLINLWLGELYERTGKLTRAWSRYVQAAIGEHAPPEAFVNLDRLNRNAEFRAGFSMADAEQLLEGRVLEFHPADHYEPGNAGTSGLPVHLVELFTSVDNSQTSAAELAFGGLGDFFGAGGAVFIEYHVDEPAPDALAAGFERTRYAFYKLEGTPAALFDGGRAVVEGGDEKAAGKVFGLYQAAALTRPKAAEAWSLAGTVGLAEESIGGEVVLEGPEAGGDLRLMVVLVEKLVMAPGGNGVVLHRQVARAMLSPEEGFAVPAATGKRVFAIRVKPAEVSAALEQNLARREKEKAISFVIRPTFVDPRACVVAAFLQDRGTKQVLAARSWDLGPSAEKD